MEGCQGKAYLQTNLRVQFAHQNPQYSIVILKEGNQPHPWCPQFDMFVPHEALNWAHPTSAMYRRRTERKSRRLVIEETEKHMGEIFSEYGTPLMAVSSFRYLGLTLSSANDDCPVVERNLRRARVKWGRLAKILGREGFYKRMAGRFYVTLVQTVLLFGSDTWVLTPRLEK